MGTAPRYSILIDGYNVIKRHPDWRHLPLQAARRRLLGHLAGVRWPVPTPSIVVVFDTQGDDAGHAPQSNLRVQFASPSADAYLQDAIRRSPSPRHLVVISDDGEILRTAKSHGAQRYPTSWIFVHSAPAAGSRASHPPKGSLPAAEARRITEELAKRWLRPSKP